MLGTFVEVGVQSRCGALTEAVDAAYSSILEVQALLSFHDVQSDLSRLNAARGEEVVLHPLSLRLLRLARAMTRASGGHFNCTVGGALVRKGALPDHGFASFLDSGEADDIELRSNKARLRRPVLITLDGIAKGYAVDCAVRVLGQRGIEAGWVNAGGDLRAFGDMVLPVHRRETDGTHTALGGLTNAAIATSRVGVRPNKEYPAWIIGAPYRPVPGIWSVMARTAWRADALTKVAGTAGDGERYTLLRRLGGRLLERTAR
jgi:FAD:protein FMN transferase